MALFHIGLEVEESAVGSLLRTLNGFPGVAKLHLDLDKVPGKKGGKRPKQNGGESSSATSRQIILRALTSGPKNLRHLEDQLRAANLSTSSLSAHLNEMKRQGVTESGGKGVHRLTKHALSQMNRSHAIALPPPEKAAKKKKPKPADKPRAGKGEATLAVVTAVAARGGKAARQDIIHALESQFATVRAVESSITRAKKAGLLKSPETGVYELTAKASEQLEATKEPA